MPHQCVRCGKLIDDGSGEILTGCTICGGKLFFFLSKEKLTSIQGKDQIKLTSHDRQKIEKDVADIIGISHFDEPVVLNFESINISEPGKFELDLVNLFDSKKPLVYKLEEGKYMIDLASSFENLTGDKISKDKKIKKKK